MRQGVRCHQQSWSTALGLKGGKHRPCLRVLWLVHHIKSDIALPEGGTILASFSDARSYWRRRRDMETKRGQVQGRVAHTRLCMSSEVHVANDFVVTTAIGRQTLLHSPLRWLRQTRELLLLQIPSTVRHKRPTQTWEQCTTTHQSLHQCNIRPHSTQTS